ncbi:hypothetical protein ACCS96_00610 [Rhizobium ruizarguesonis]
MKSRVAAAFPNNYLDVRSMIIALQAPGQPYQDGAAYADDVVSAALRADGLHLNETGVALYAGFIGDRLIADGW